MSYCRFGKADAYIYDHISVGLICQVCSLMPIGTTNGLPGLDGEDIWLNDDFIAGYDYDKMLEHITQHRLKGDHIPSDVDQRLIADRDCEHIFEEGKYGIRCRHCWRPQDAA